WLWPWPPGRPTPPAAELLREGVHAFYRLGGLSYSTRRPASAFYTLVKALNLGEHLGTRPDLAKACADVGNVARAVPLHALARHYGRRARQIARKLGDPATTARVLGRTGIYRAAVGDWSCCADLETAMELADQVGDAYQWEESATIRSFAAHMLGELELAARLGEEVRARAVASAAEAHQVWGITGQASALLYLGQTEKA